VTVDVNLVPVRGGSSIVGTSRLGSEDVVGGFAAEPRELDFAPFLIGKYPVTNAEYGAFIEGGGYTNLDYWPAERGRAWAAGDPAVLHEIRQHWMETVYEHHAKELRDGEISEAKLEEECISRTTPLGKPFYWHDRRFNQANQPVVGINWWEAAAYCTWATRLAHESGCLDTSYVAALPTEFEWELASRPLPDDRVYPWGDSWDDEKAHVTTNALNMRQPSPVGIYPEPWPGAPRDQAGNVWEWTASLFVPDTEANQDQALLDPDSFGERVVKGSSWYNRSGLAACSARAVDRSYNLFYDVGFRVVIVERDAPRAGCS
jgi:formylglycine-generating enzyme required for sulfatase activity